MTVDSPTQEISEDKVLNLQWKLNQAAKTDPEMYFFRLYDKIYWAPILYVAWNMVKENKGTCGVDEQTIEDIIRGGEEQFIKSIQEQLRNKTYRPQPVQRVFIEKANGKLRPLGIPTVIDRVVQTAVKIVVEPIFEADFQDFSYGYRPGRNAQQAADEIRKWINFGCADVVDADIQAYFDTIPHDRLMAVIQRRIRDRAILDLMRGWLKAGIMEDGTIHPNVMGTPQGGVISPLFANIYLNQLDTYWSEHGYNTRYGGDAHLVRYADDIIILCSHDVEKYHRILAEQIAGLGLTLSAEKTKVLGAEEGFEFLGFQFWRKKSVRGKMNCYYAPRKKAEAEIRLKVRTKLKQNQNVPTKDIPKILNPIIRGWGNYYLHSNANKAFQRVDQYVRETVLHFILRRMKKRGYRHGKDCFHYLYDILGLAQLVGRVKYR
jgi:RNA-directed DNA polymerase